MSDLVFELPQNSSRVLYATLTQDDGVTPLTSGLVGCTVTLLMRDPNTLVPTLSAGATVDDVVACNVHYGFTTANSAVPGDYLAQWIVGFPDGEIVPIPTAGYFTVRITPALDTPTYPMPGGTSGFDLLEETRQHIEGPQRIVLNTLSAALDRTVTAVPLVTDTLVNPGDRLSAGLETFYVTSYDQAARRANVIRGADNSPITNHLAGELVRVNPRYTNYRMFRALNSALGQLSSDGLWWPKQVFRTVNTTTQTYDFASDAIGKQVLDISYNRAGGYHQWQQIRDFDVFPSVDKAQYPSGTAILIPVPMTQGQPLRITYKANLGTLTSLADNVAEVTGLASTALDLPPLAAAVALLAGAPVQRSDTRGQGTTRRAEEVSTSDTLNSTSALRQRYMQRVNQEAGSLQQQWPTKRLLRRLV